MENWWDALLGARFMPHGHCYFWEPALLVLQVGSDALIAGAYYSIPLALMYFVRRRSDLEFDWMFIMFATFIFACGTTHLMSIVTVWNPVYWIDGAVKAVTAVVSCVTALLLWPLIPRALKIPSPRQLQREIDRNREIQRELEMAHRTLELRVSERTAELEQKKSTLDRLNRELSIEVEERRHAEEKLKVLLAELDHRVKNSLSVVLAICNQMLLQQPSIDEFREAFTHRVQALARVQRLLTENQWEGASLREIVALTLEPFTLAGARRIAAEDIPEIRLKMNQVQPLYLVFHELAINAAKHGCFSTSSGHLVLAGEVEEREGGQWLILRWLERGGPPAAPPTREGFGTRLLEISISGDLDGKYSTHFGAEGLEVELEIPLTQASAH